MPNIAPCIVGNLAINLLIYLKYTDFNYKLEIFVKNCSLGKKVSPTPHILLILTEQRCNMVQSDKGTEFLNSTFQSMLRRYDVKFYTRENKDIKAAVVERFNRTLKQKMYLFQVSPQPIAQVHAIFKKKRQPRMFSLR